MLKTVIASLLLLTSAPVAPAAGQEQAFDEVVAELGPKIHQSEGVHDHGARPARPLRREEAAEGRALSLTLSGVDLRQVTRSAE